MKDLNLTIKKKGLYTNIFMEESSVIRSTTFPVVFKRSAIPAVLQAVAVTKVSAICCQRLQAPGETI